MPRWGSLSQFPFRSVISHFSQNYKNTGHSLNITFTFDQCCIGWVVVTPVNYEWDSQDITAILQNPENSDGDVNECILVVPHLAAFLATEDSLVYTQYHGVCGRLQKRSYGHRCSAANTINNYKHGGSFYIQMPRFYGQYLFGVSELRRILVPIFSA